jgi:hypothetical protein
MIVSCEQCGKEFNKAPHKIGSRPRHFCSRKCYDLTMHKNVFNVFLKQARAGLKRKQKNRNLEFSVTSEELEEIWNSQDGKCKLTGEPLTLGSSRTDFTRTASLDRIDSSVGYVKSNIQWLHKHVNNMKQSLDESYFIKMCGRVANHCRMWFY